MKNLFLFLLLGSSLCFASPGAAPIPRRLYYRFDLTDPTHVRVTLEFSAPGRPASMLLLPSLWAGQSRLYGAISNLHTTSPGAVLAPTVDPARWLLQHPQSGLVSIAYNLSQDWAGPLQHPFEHRPILEPTLFEFNGSNGLVAPAISGTEVIDASFDFVGLPSGETLVTSFGMSNHQHFVGPWSEVRNALFTGGEMKTDHLLVNGHSVLLAIHGTWGFGPQDISPKIQSILEAERRLWHDAGTPFYAIVISPYESTTSGGGGSGFTNIFNLFLADRDTFSTDTAALVAHEAFHQWNPRALGSVEDTNRIAWFGEGFTRFYQDTVLEHAGIIGKAEYLTRLNATIRDYLLSPALNVPNTGLVHEAAASEFPGDAAVGSPKPVAYPGNTSVADSSDPPEPSRTSSLLLTPSPRLLTPSLAVDAPASQQPYLRGAIIALWLSHEIHQQSRGRHSLTDFMLALEAAHTQPLTPDRIFSTAAHFVDSSTVARMRTYALDGITVPVSPGSLGECVVFTDQPAWTFDLGFDLASLRHQGTIRGVEQGSRAWQAGVRDGQQVGGFSLWKGNADREVNLTLSEASGKRQNVAFLPRGRLLSAPQAEQIPGCLEGPLIPQ